MFVPVAGLEPARHWRLLLMQACLPFHHTGIIVLQPGFEPGRLRTAF